MHRLSSNATLFFKLFLPVFWTTIMVGLTLVAWFADVSQFGGMNMSGLRYASLFALVTGTVVFYLLCWPLKRVETDGTRVFVSDYFRTAHYRWDRDVEALHEFSYFPFRVGVLELNGVGSFGRKMRFLISGRLLEAFRAEHPGVIPAPDPAQP